MTKDEEYAKARDQLEQAIQEMVRISREDDESFLFLQDYVIMTACESMEPGQGNMTFTNTITRPGMSVYSVIGLHQQAIHHYLHSSKEG